MGFPFHYFKYNRAQQSGLFVLLVIIVGLLLANHYVSFPSKNELVVDHELMNQFQREVDSLQKLNQQKKYTPKPFNPNYINDYKGYQLNMSLAEIDRLLAYRDQGNYVNSAADFQKVTKVSDSLLAKISTYFKFPDWTQKKATISKQKTLKSAKSAAAKKDLNTASVHDFQKIKGIGATFSNRIVKYRNLLGGFSVHEQLGEVYGIDDALVKKILTSFEIKQPPKIQKLNINSATFKEIMGLPYTDYEMTKQIFQYKNEVSKINSIKELSLIEGLTAKKIDRLMLYLKVN